MGRHRKTRLTDPFGPHGGRRMDVERDAGDYVGKHRSGPGMYSPGWLPIEAVTMTR
ncbi:Uncharacterised protein [Mycobacteroides abscessus subsp. bolletii]|nr:Uncharacterised protein [Mycobacteroides abscessus subsp. bolletii]